MRLIGCILLIISTTAAGCYLSAMIKRRIRLFNTLALLAGNVSAAIRYSGDDITKILLQEGLLLKLDFIKNAVSCVEKGEALEKGWQESVDGIPVFCGITKEDRALIKQFGSKLGTTDVYGQTDHCEYFKELFHSRASKLAQECVGKSRVYRCLGFFSGAAISLAVI